MNSPLGINIEDANKKIGMQEQQAIIINPLANFLSLIDC